MGAQHQHTGLGTRQPAVHKLGVQRGRARPALGPVRREDQGRGAVVQQPHARTSQQRDSHRRLRIGSSGDFGPAPMTAVDVKTGKVTWQDRTFGKVNMVLADGKVILLDEGGDLALVTLSPEGMQVRWRVPLLESNAWTAPTLVGTKLYVRDRRTMMALDLR